MDVDSYLARIGVAPSALAGAGLTTLGALHHAHVTTVPFENLDIHLGRPISLDVDETFAKVVGDHRGGYCYELNPLFAALLDTLGFDVALVAAREHNNGGPLTDPAAAFEHTRILVTIDDARWLADVGNGASLLAPLDLDDPSPHEQGHATFKVEPFEEGSFLTSRLKPDGEWQSEWRFDLTPRSIDEFADRNHFQQHDPMSHFLEGPFVTIVDDSGWRTLSARRLISTHRGVRVEETVGPDEDVQRVLADLFGITLTSDEVIRAFSSKSPAV